MPTVEVLVLRLIRIFRRYREFWPLGSGITVPELFEIGLQLIALLPDPGGVVISVPITIAGIADQGHERPFCAISGHLCHQLHGPINIGACRASALSPDDLF